MTSGHGGSSCSPSASIIFVICFEVLLHSKAVGVGMWMCECVYGGGGRINHAGETPSGVTTPCHMFWSNPRLVEIKPCSHVRCGCSATSPTSSTPPPPLTSDILPSDSSWATSFSRRWYSSLELVARWASSSIFSRSASDCIREQRALCVSPRTGRYSRLPGQRKLKQRWYQFKSPHQLQLQLQGVRFALL